MSHTPNELADMFPEHVEQLREMKMENSEFSKTFDEYHELTRKIHRGETDVEPMSDVHMENLRKLRLQMLDRISAILHR